MKTILITENQFKMLIENIINEQYNPDIESEKKKFKKESDMKIWFLENVVDKVEKKIDPKYPNYILYINKNTDRQYMGYNKYNNNLYVDYDKIWSYFRSNYSNNDKEINELIKFLVSEYYGLLNVTPVRFSLASSE